MDNTICDNCGLCDRICPIENLKIKENIGNVSKVVIGKSKQPDVIRFSASGGIVTEILLHLLRNKLVDAALVAFYDAHANIYGDFIESAEDVMEHSGSYYHTSKQLINIQKIRNYNKVAVVGLPCHIEGIINYCGLTKQSNKVFKIGLFCTIGRTYEGFRHFLKKETGFDIAAEAVRTYISRQGEKKMIHIEDDEGNVYECPDEAYKFSMDFFYANQSCLDCRKLYGLSADISVGDAWHRMRMVDGVKEKLAIVTANSKEGIDVLNILQKSLSLEETDDCIRELMKSQKYGFSLKQLHDKNIVRGLNNLRKFKKLNDNLFLFQISIRIRGLILGKLAADTKKMIEDLDNR